MVETDAVARRSVTLGDLLAILARRWRTVVLCAAAATGLAIVYLCLATPLYTATTSILIDPRGRQQLSSDSNIPPEALDATMVESQLRVIASDTVLQRVIDSEKLGDDTEFAPGPPGLVSRLLGLFRPGQAGHAPEQAASRTLVALARAVSVKRSERTYVIDMEVTSRDANKAARLASAIAAAYMEDQQAAKAALADRQGTYLKARLADLQAKLQDAETKVQEFKQQNRIFDANGKLVDEDQLSELNTGLARARVRTAEARAKYEEVQRVLRSGASPDALGDALKSPQIERLRTQYAEIVRQEAIDRASLGTQHPSYIEVQTQLRDTRRLIVEELKRITDAAANEYQLARAAETQIAKQVEAASQVSSTTNQALVRLRELQRDVDANRTIYDKFLRARETVREEGADLPTARVIAPASTPLSPSSPKSSVILLLAVIAGFGTGVATAALREYLERTHRKPDTGASMAAPIPTARQPAAPEPNRFGIIGSVPRVTGEAASGFAALFPWLARFGRSRIAAEIAPIRLLHAYADDPRSSFSQAIRALRDELRTGAGGRPLKVVLITSDAPGAGKTTIAVNLARAAAERGERALVIDANPAHPALAELVSPEMSPGLIELAGTTRLLYRIGANPDEALFIVPIVPDEDKAVRRLLRHTSIEPLDGIKSNFDFIVIDGPSIATDDTARMVAGAVDQVVLVVPAATPHGAVEDALDRLEVPSWKFRGAVVSMVDLKAAA